MTYFVCLLKTLKEKFSWIYLITVCAGIAGAFFAVYFVEGRVLSLWQIVALIAIFSVIDALVAAFINYKKQKNN